MSNVIVKENESLDSALRRFKRNCAKAGIQQEIRKREHYEKPSVRRKKKSEAAKKRSAWIALRRNRNDSIYSKNTCTPLRIWYYINIK